MDRPVDYELLRGKRGVLQLVPLPKCTCTSNRLTPCQKKLTTFSNEAELDEYCLMKKKGPYRRRDRNIVIERSKIERASVASQTKTTPSRVRFGNVQTRFIESR